MSDKVVAHNDKTVPKVRFYLFFPDGKKVELKQVLFAAHSDGCEYFLTSDEVVPRDTSTER